jgi:hypothetical protein
LTVGDATDADRRLNLIAQEVSHDFFGDRYLPRRVSSGRYRRRRNG